MTLADLIESCLRAIRSRWYASAGEHAWNRDKLALTKAIARYGYECDRRGWDFEEAAICRQIMELLPKIARPDHQWLPSYLESCIDRHIRTRAEELSAEAKRLDLKVRRVTETARDAMPEAGVVVREKTVVETLAGLYRDLKRRQQQRAKEKKARHQATALQEELL